MKKALVCVLSPLLMTGCSVLGATVAVGAAAVNVATTGVGIAWDVGKAGVVGTAALVEMATADDASAPAAAKPAASAPVAVTPPPAPVPEVSPVQVTPLTD